MMRSPATDRRRLLEIATATLEMLHSDEISRALTESVPAEELGQEKIDRDIISNTLSSAVDWARMEEQAAQPVEESLAPSAFVEPYIPSNQALSLIQTAYDEYAKVR